MTQEVLRAWYEGVSIGAILRIFDLTRVQLYAIIKADPKETT